MKIFFEVATTVGKIRLKNQDNFYVNGKMKKEEDEDCIWKGISERNSQVYAICDGMGGEDKGEVASSIAVQTLNNFFLKGKINWSEYIKKVNRIIYEYQIKYHINMGTTFAAICIEKSKLISVNVGDTRIYRIRNSEIRQLSKDHNEYQMMVDAGIKVKEDVARKRRSRLTQFLGLSDEEFDIEPYLIEKNDIIPGDCYLICSDGLYEVLTDAQIIKIIEDNIEEKKESCEALIKQAVELGSTDNITAILIHIL